MQAELTQVEAPIVGTRVYQADWLGGEFKFSEGEVSRVTPKFVWVKAIPSKERIYNPWSTWRGGTRMSWARFEGIAKSHADAIAKEIALNEERLASHKAAIVTYTQRSESLTEDLAQMRAAAAK